MSDVVSAAGEPLLPPSEPDIKRPWMVVAGGFLVLLLIAALMYRAGLFDAPDDQVESETLAAVLGLLGALLTELIVAAGLLLKHSFDLRTYQLARYEQQRLALETQRNLELKDREQQRLDDEAERANQNKAIEQERLRKDTVLKAVELLGDDSGNDASPARQVGAIRALATLGELELAVSLLDQLWSDQTTPKLPVAGALAVVDCVFDRPVAADERDMRREAGTILQWNAQKLFTEDDAMLPRIIREGAWLKLPAPIARSLVLTLSKGSASVFPGLATVSSVVVRYVTSYLVGFARTSTDETNRLIAAYTGLELIRALPRQDHIILGSEMLSPDQLEAQMREVIHDGPVPLAAQEWVERLRAWSDDVEGSRRKGQPVPAKGTTATSKRRRPGTEATRRS